MWYEYDITMMTNHMILHIALHQLGLHDCDMVILALPTADFTVDKAKPLWMV